MGISFVLVGIALVVTGMQNTYSAAGSEIYTDMVGSSGSVSIVGTAGKSSTSASGGFVVWLIAIACVGVLGYIPTLRTFSTWFMALIVLAIFLSKGTGFFSQFQAALKAGPTLPTAPASSTSSTSTGSTTTTTSTLSSLWQFLNSPQSLFGSSGNIITDLGGK